MLVSPSVISSTLVDYEYVVGFSTSISEQRQLMSKVDTLEKELFMKVKCCLKSCFGSYSE